MKEIVKVVSEYYDIPVDVMKSRLKRREIVIARMMAMYFGRRLTILPLEKIGAYLDRSHASVLHAIKTVRNDIKFSKPIQDDVKNLAIILKTTPLDVEIKKNYVIGLGYKNREEKYNALVEFCKNNEITMFCETHNIPM